MRNYLVLVCLFSLAGYFVHGISLPFRVPSFGMKPLGSRPPVRKSKLGAAIEKAVKVSSHTIDTYVAPVVEKVTPAAVKPYLASADRYLKNEWTAAKKEWAECKKIYAKARNNYEKVDKVVYILQRNKYNILKAFGVGLLTARIETAIYEWYTQCTLLFFIYIFDTTHLSPTCTFVQDARGGYTSPTGTAEVGLQGRRAHRMKIEDSHLHHCGLIFLFWH